MLTPFLAGALLTTALSAPAFVPTGRRRLVPGALGAAAGGWIDVENHAAQGNGPSGPVTYTATFPCTDGRVATATFTVTGPTSPPSSSAALRRTHRNPHTGGARAPGEGPAGG